MPHAGSSWAPDRGEAVLICLTPRGTKEARAEIAMVVLSPKAFNERTGQVIGFPVGQAVAHETNPFAIKHVGDNGIACYVLTHQPRSMDWRACDARPHPWMALPQELFVEACEGLNQIIQLGG
jgi:mRNA interferase MazF